MPFDPFQQAQLQQAQERLAQPAETQVYDIEDIRRLAGLGTGVYPAAAKGAAAGSNISITGNEKGQLMKQHNIQPGTQEWFRLWFSLPYLTNTSPLDPKFKKDSFT